jgi:hypothetical protein
MSGSTADRKGQRPARDRCQHRREVLADGAPSGQDKAAHRGRRRARHAVPYCIKGHTKAALRAGASREELMEAIWVAAEMRAGRAYAHSILAIEDMETVERRTA